MLDGQGEGEGEGCGWHLTQHLLVLLWVQSEEEEEEEEKDEVASLILLDVLLRLLVSGSHFRCWSCLRCTVYGLFWEITSGMVSVCDTPWFNRGYMRASVYEAFWKNFGVVQTVQKTVKIPHAFLDMVVDKCWIG